MPDSDKAAGGAAGVLARWQRQGATQPRSAAAPVARSDEDLMRLVQADDRQAFDELYGRHHAKIARRARILCDAPEGAEEAVQDAFLSLWRSRATFEFDRASIETWLHALVHNRSIDIHRRDRRYAVQRESEAALAGITAPGCLEDDAVRRDEDGRLRASLRSIPDVQREAVVLAFFGGLTHLEIAMRLDLPLGTVKGRIRLGLLKARARVDRDEARIGDCVGSASGTA